MRFRFAFLLLVLTILSAGAFAESIEYVKKIYNVSAENPLPSDIVIGFGSRGTALGYLDSAGFHEGLPPEYLAKYAGTIYAQQGTATAIATQDLLGSGVFLTNNLVIGNWAWLLANKLTIDMSYFTRVGNSLVEKRGIVNVYMPEAGANYEIYGYSRGKDAFAVKDTIGTTYVIERVGTGYQANTLAMNSTNYASIPKHKFAAILRRYARSYSGGADIPSPVQGASLQFYDAETQGLLGSGTTNAQGIVYFDNLPAKIGYVNYYIPGEGYYSTGALSESEKLQGRIITLADTRAYKLDKISDFGAKGWIHIYIYSSNPISQYLGITFKDPVSGKTLSSSIEPNNKKSMMITEKEAKYLFEICVADASVYYNNVPSKCPPKTRSVIDYKNTGLNVSLEYGGKTLSLTQDFYANPIYVFNLDSAGSSGGAGYQWSLPIRILSNQPIYSQNVQVCVTINSVQKCSTQTITPSSQFNLDFTQASAQKQTATPLTGWILRIFSRR
jgi:hypothetical protein